MASFLLLQTGGKLLLAAGGGLLLQAQDAPAAQVFGHASLWPDMPPRGNPDPEEEEVSVLLALVAARGRSGGPK